VRIPLALIFAPALFAQNDWPVYGHDPGHMKYSPLAQINTANVATLSRAWTYHTGEKARAFETTPLAIGGILYFTTQNQRVIAIDGATGAEIWNFDPKVRRPREHRGVSYWPGDAKTRARILFGTADGRLLALDAQTGKPAAEFGDNGSVDLRAGIADAFPSASYSVSSPPAIYRDLVIVGPSVQEGPSKGPSGDPRAFDVRTGKMVWRFRTLPQPGEPGNDTWGPDGWKDRAGPSVWAPITVDTERGMVFLTTGNAADSFYGADRPGTNLYANCVIALDAATGKMRWYFQVVHHDIFDYDVAAAPTLIETVQNGQRIPAVAQITKSGLLFILNRETGKPVFGVEERPVAKSDVPGEQSWPTQPFPLKPPPLARTTISRDDIFQRTPESARYCLDLFDKAQHEGPYTPFGAAKTTILFPGTMGGGNWGGVSFDPALGFVFANTTNVGGLGHMVPAPPGVPVAYRNESGYARYIDPDGYPCQRPPWGELTAVNANTGEIAWRVPLGSFEQMEALGYKDAGTPSVGGNIATAGGLVFAAGTNDARLRAFDSRTGKPLWVGKLDATGGATPITYRGRDGKQFVVIAAGGPGHMNMVGDNSKNAADTVIAFSLDGTAAPSAAATESTPVAATASAAVLPEGKEKQVVMRVCTKCHGLTTFAKTRLTRELWNKEVDDMIARGAIATDEEVVVIVDYLVKNLGRQ
jgi:quinoprotein glucose dehydrogenase